METIKVKTPTILIAEDDEDDFFLMKRNFNLRYPQVHMVRVNHGEELLEYLQTHEAPSVIILDLNMPRKDGREALKDIRRQPSLEKIPIIVFTTSYSDLDQQFVVDNGAVFYPKPYEILNYYSFMNFFQKYIE